jgi:hypothetical protein
MLSLTRVLLCCFLVLAGGSPLFAQPVGIKVDSGLRAYPSLEFHYTYNSNFFATADDKVFVAGAVVEPAIKLEKTTRRLQLSVAAEAEVADFDNGSEDDYVDAELATHFQYRAGTRHRFGGSAAYAEGHDAFGLRRTEGLPIAADRELDEYHIVRGSLVYRYGALNSLLNVAYEISYLEREYDTNRELGTHFLDYDFLQHQGTLYWNYSPKTSAILRASRRDIEYPITQVGFLDRAATEDRAGVGLEWLPSGKSNGELLVGRFKRDPDEPGFEEFSGGFWSVRAEWAPRKTTVLSFVSGRESNESFLLNASVVDTKGATLSWHQQWNSVTSSSVSVAYAERDFEAIGRTDDYASASFKLALRVVQQLFIDFNAAYTDRDSTLDVRDYGQAVFSVGFRYAP